MNNDEYRRIFIDFAGEQSDLIPLLQACQNKFGYISQECVQQIADFLDISDNHVFGVASFYSQFSFHEPGKNKIRVCLGTACHVQGGKQLSKEVQSLLKIQPGVAAGTGSSLDKQYEYHEVACLGCCAQASVVEINGKIYGKMTTDKLVKALESNG